MVTIDKVQLIEMFRTNKETGGYEGDYIVSLRPSEIFLTDSNMEKDIVEKENLVASFSNGWAIKGKIETDYYAWIELFIAKNGNDFVYGSTNKKLAASSMEAFDDFCKCFEFVCWDKFDI